MGGKPTIFGNTLLVPERSIFLPVFCWVACLDWFPVVEVGCLDDFKVIDAPWWNVGEVWGVMWNPRRCEVSVKPWGWDVVKRLGFLYVGSFLSESDSNVVVVVKGWFWKDIPCMETFSNFEVNRSGAKLSSWIQSLGVMNDWMTERVAKIRVKEEEVLVSFCRSPEMSQHLAVLLVSVLKVGWSFWTTYNASKQIYRKLSTRRRWRKRSLRPWNCLLDGDLHQHDTGLRGLHLLLGVMKHEEYLTKVPTLQDAAENFSPFCFQEETCTCC